MIVMLFLWIGNKSCRSSSEPVNFPGPDCDSGKAAASERLRIRLQLYSSFAWRNEIYPTTGQTWWWIKKKIIPGSDCKYLDPKSYGIIDPFIRFRREIHMDPTSTWTFCWEVYWYHRLFTVDFGNIAPSSVLVQSISTIRDSAWKPGNDANNYA